MTEALRVCFIEDTGLHGGTQIWVAEATEFLLAQGVGVTLLTSESGWNAKECAKTDARLVTYDYHQVVEERSMDRAIWTDALADADVAICTVHPPRRGFHCAVFAASCIEEEKLDTVLLPKTGTIVPEYERRFYVPSPEIRSGVIAITRFTRDYLVESYGIESERVALLYQGTDVARYTPAAERALQARRCYQLPTSASFVVGNVGSFEERKGQTLLLEAMAMARRSVPGIHLMLVGDGPDETMLREKTDALDLQDNVSFFPFTREPELVFERIDALVLPSLRKEGLPNVLLESMAMGVPVVSAQLAGTPEVVIEGETGLLVPPGDVGALADALERMGRDHPARSRMGVAGRQLMEQGFDKRKQFHAFMDHYRSVAGS